VAEKSENSLSTNDDTSGPYFEAESFRNLTVLVDNTAYLKCRVRNIGNKTISWVRHRDINLLTVGKFSYTSDNRFQSLHDYDSDEWMLKLQFAQIKDSGVYECQISTTPPKGYPGLWQKLSVFSCLQMESTKTI